MAALPAIKQSPDAAAPAQKSASHAGRAFQATLLAMQAPGALSKTNPPDAAARPHIATATETAPKHTAAAAKTQAKTAPPASPAQTLNATVTPLPSQPDTVDAEPPVAAALRPATPQADASATTAQAAHDAGAAPQPPASGQDAPTPSTIPAQTSQAQPPAAGAGLQDAAPNLNAPTNSGPAHAAARPGPGARQAKQGDVQTASARMAVTALPALAALLPDGDAAPTGTDRIAQAPSAPNALSEAGAAHTQDTGADAGASEAAKPSTPPSQSHARSAAAPPQNPAVQAGEAPPTPSGQSAAPAAQDPPAAQAAPTVQIAAPAQTPHQSTQMPAAPSAATTQLAPILTAVHVPQGSTKDITIQLQPETLGGLQVRITRGADGAASVTLQADRADTLHTLQQDAGHLHQALDRAGLPAENRSLTFQLSHEAAAGAGGTPGGDMSGAGGFTGQPGNPGGGTSRHQGQAAHHAPRNPAPDLGLTAGQQAAVAQQGGLNITA